MAKKKGFWDNEELPGEKEREEGIDKVQSPIVTAAWLPFARKAVYRAAKSLEYLTSEDVWADLEDNGLEGPSDNRAMGAVMRWAENELLIEITDRVVPASRPSRHRAPIRLYKSRVYRGY